MGQDIAKSAFWRRATTLEARFTLFVALLLMTLGLLTAVLVLDANRRQSINEMRAVTSEIGKVAAVRLAAPIEKGETAILGPVLETLIQGPHVISASIVDAKGAPIAARWGPARNVTRGAVAHVRVPIKSKTGKTVGALVYSMAAEEVASAGASGLSLALIGVGIFILSSIPLTIAVVRRATAPLRELIEFAEGLNAQKLTQQIEIKSGDEFETLARAFNHMIGRLNATMRKMQRIAFVDPMTNLPNLDRLIRDVKTAIERAGHVGYPGALFLVSVDRASRVAESLGDEAGRDLLLAAAQRLSTAAAASDPWANRQGEERGELVVARTGAAEFAVLYPTLPKGVDLQALAQSLVGAFIEPFSWREHRIALPGHAGAAFFPRDGQDADTLMRHARLALNAVRGSGATYKFFTRSLDREASARLNLEREIRAGLENNEFRAYFQPKVNLRTGRIEGAEALARWVRADHSIISPGKFIPAAEEMGLIGPISEAILRDACWKAAAWSREGLPARVAVNVSALQFADDNFPAKVLKICDQAGLPTQCLELEITESIAMEDVERALRMIEPLRARGVRFSIDDFGTGHSSLAALTRLPFEVLKIDQSFVRGLSVDKQAAAIVETILAMAAALDYEVVAEGVETEEEAEFLRRRGCPIGQGFLYSAAQPPTEYGRMLREGAVLSRKGDKSALDSAA
jgi:EAL domain-containing protein (putative c-di-GMP-specific phosphodiesterase class I)/GGDEF domain-containing protein